MPRWRFGQFGVNAPQTVINSSEQVRAASLDDWIGEAQRSRRHSSQENRDSREKLAEIYVGCTEGCDELVSNPCYLW